MRALALVVIATAALAQKPMQPSADRNAPPTVKPVTVGLVRYGQDLAWPGYLFARSSKSGELLYVTQVYPQRLVAGLEDGEVYFASMTHDPKAETLTIVDEAGRTHVVSLKERGSDWPARVELVKAAPLTVRLTIPNLGAKTLELDEPTVCKGGALSNSVFRLAVDGKRVDYLGMMAKRARPDSFIKVKPGKSWQVEVDLSSDYALPEKGALTIRYETFNHFSRDELTIVSNELVVQRP